MFIHKCLRFFFIKQSFCLIIITTPVHFTGTSTMPLEGDIFAKHHVYATVNCKHVYKNNTTTIKQVGQYVN